MGILSKWVDLLTVDKTEKRIKKAFKKNKRLNSKSRKLISCQNKK